MILEGTITRCLPIKEGVTREGKQWKKAMYVLGTNDRYPRRIVFSVMGDDRINDFNFQANQKVRLGVDIESREWQEHWFTEIRCVASLDPSAEGVAKAAPAQPAPQPQPVQTPIPTAPTLSDKLEDSSELPF